MTPRPRPSSSRFWCSARSPRSSTLSRLTHPDMTLGEIQQATGLPTSTVQRLVSNMAAQGLLDRKGDRIRIGVRMSYWAATALKDLDVLAAGQPGAQGDPRQDRRDRPASSRWNRTSGCASPVAETRHALRRDMYVGKVIPLHVGSASRMLLAWNPDLAEKVLAAPLEPADRRNGHESRRTAQAASRRPRRTVTRSLRANARTPHPGSRRRSSMPRVTSSARSRSADRLSECRTRSARPGSTSWSATPNRCTRTIGGRLPH